MPGKIDEFSRVLGGLEQSTEGLREAFNQHCLDDQSRHQENIEQFREVTKELRTLNDTLIPLAQTVRTMKPILDGYQISRWKMAGAISLAMLLVGLFGWAVQALLGKAGAWLIALLTMK